MQPWLHDCIVECVGDSLQGALLSADVAKLPDGSMWFVAGCQDATVHIWKVSPGNMPGRLQIVASLSAGMLNLYQR